MAEPTADRIIICNLFNLFFREVLGLTADTWHVGSERLKKFGKQSILCLNEVNQLCFRNCFWVKIIGRVPFQVTKYDFVCDVRLIRFLEIISDLTYRFKVDSQLAVKVENGILIGVLKNIWKRTLGLQQACCCSLLTKKITNIQLTCFGYQTSSSKDIQAPILCSGFGPSWYFWSPFLQGN